MNIKCASCLAGRAWECALKGDCSHGVFDNSDLSSSDIPSGDTFQMALGSDSDLGNAAGNGEGSDVFEDSSAGRAGKPVRVVNTYKEDSAIRDQQSTGRKRAAVMYPLDSEANCEWQGLANAGGGSNPIVGCPDGKQQARHHGPDKNTLNNESGNVHRICHNCHNRWHARNDEGYVWGAIYPTHSPRSATFEELLASQAYWVKQTVKKAVD